MAGKEINWQTHQFSSKIMPPSLMSDSVISGYGFSLFLRTSYFDKENHYKCSETINMKTIFDRISMLLVCRQIALFRFFSSFSLGGKQILKTVPLS